MPSVARAWRRLRYGQPIVVVSGLPRSGTSMAMRMLEAGGMPLLTDGVRTSDASNPRGYFEYEPVKALEHHADVSWLPRAQGKAVKIISFLLTWLPDTYDYHVIFMQRDMQEILASQEQMLARTEGARSNDTRIADVYGDHLRQVARFMAQRPCFRSLTLLYGDVVDRPEAAATRIRAFLTRPLDISRMAAAVDRDLYRNRRPT